MSTFDKLIEFGTENEQEPPRQNINNDGTINKLAKYFKTLTTAMRYIIDHEKKLSSHTRITDKMNSELCRVFGPNWYEKKNKSWTENDFDIIYDALLEVVMNQSNHFSLCNKIQPFLQHINDGGNLNSLYAQLQNPYNNNEVVIKALVHNVVNASKSNDNLKKVLEVVLGIRD